jgi:hypothetical protein
MSWLEESEALNSPEQRLAAITSSRRQLFV